MDNSIGKLIINTKKVVNGNLLNKGFGYLYIILTLWLVSCNSTEKFVGEWKGESDFNGTNILRLYEDGRYRWLRENAIVPLKTGEWSVSGDKILFSDDEYPSDSEYEYKIIRINANELIIRDETFAKWTWHEIEFEKVKH